MISFLQSEKFKAGLPKVLIITVVWMLIGVLEVSFDHLNFHQHEIHPANYNYWVALKSNIVGVSIAAFLASFCLVYMLNDQLRTRSYGRVLWTVFGYYNLIFFIGIIFGSAVHKCEMSDLMGINANIFWGVWEYISELKFIRSYFFWAIVSLLTIIALQVNDKYGDGVFLAFLRGAYFQPKKEERIFMFLDLRGSTTIAEQIGEERYFDFIRDFFKDVTPSILANKGEIYQYVGDEVIVSWQKEKGLDKDRVLRCFFEIEKAIQAKAAIYQQKYGVIPSFKAGLHLGTAMIGEIGVIKKDIAFSGDVLNTTSRIQARCNEYGVDLLISEALVNALELSDLYAPKRIGEVKLRGKAKPVTLFTIEELMPAIRFKKENKPAWDFAFSWN